MKNLTYYILICAFAPAIFFACSNKTEKTIDMDNYFAWCIVPFDSQNRTPEQRIQMLKEIGFKAYAYDWREKHLAEMAHELRLAKQNDIQITAIWMWIDASDTIGRLSANNEKILKIIEETETKTQLWLGISEGWLDGLSDATSMAKCQEMLKFLHSQVAPLGCTIGLYNHGGWFGDPHNQVKLIQNLPDLDLGIIFNFHHAHELLDDFPALVEAMLPHLWVVNLNGMRAEGPKILTIGQGNLEKEMIDELTKKGFRGPYGILGHIEEEDVKAVLERNLDGLKAL